MIKYFSVKNFFSIREEIFFELDISKDGLNSNNSIVLFGANASGKTTILKAISFLFWFMKDSFFTLKPNGDIPIKTFANNRGNTKFYMEFVIKENLYRYSLELNRGGVIYEKLEKNRFKKPIYERMEEDFLYLRGIRRSNLEDLPKNVSIISFLSRFKTQKYAREIFQYNCISNVKFSGLFDKNPNYRRIAKEIFQRKLKQKVLNFLKIADTEIIDFYFETIEILDENKNQIVKQLKDNNLIPKQLKDRIINDLLNNRDERLLFRHKSKDKNFTLDFEFESDGTKKIFLYSIYILDIIENGGVLIIDEINSHLHFILVEYIIDLFKSSKGQIICSSHSPTIIENFNKNELWFVEKKQGNTTLFCASDFKELEKGFNLETLYKIGRFGAIPKVIFEDRLNG